ncbi:MAG: Coq4 family protein [Planctomycetota bacterium]
MAYLLRRFLPPKLAGADAFRSAIGMLGMLRDVHDIQNIYHIENGLLDARVTCGMLSHLHSQPTVAAILADRYVRGTPPEVDMLRTLPEGSVGRELARHIDDYGFDADYYQQLPEDDNHNPEIVTALNRLRETHDVWHVVLGFHPTPVGEVGVKAFEFAQTRRPMAAVILAGALLRYAVAGEQFDEVLGAIVAGYHMGKKAQPVLGERWEQNWAEPVEAIRARLDIELPDPRSLGAEDPMGVKPSHRAG